MSYYTGTIFEITIDGYNFSIAGGGRYDEMIGRASPPSPVVRDCAWAFCVGGAICTLGEGLRQLYLGYWIAGHGKMDYKRRFRPLEAFDGRGWQPFDDDPPGDRT